MNKKISVQEAVVLWLSGFESKVAFFDSELSSFLYQIRETRYFQGHEIKGFRTDSNMKRKFLEASQHLTENNFVERKNKKYFTLGNQTPSELDVICSLYDFGYISYLSAMQFYKLTDKKSKKIDYTVPTRPIWKKLQLEAFLKSNADDKVSKNITFIPSYPSERIKINNKHLNVYSRAHTYRYTESGEITRVISIGDLFLEMVRHPELCGGFQHVLEVYKSNSRKFLNEIIESVEEYGRDIDKSRIGFIISSYLGIYDKRITDWKRDSISRGGSRKMISNDTYSNIYSEEWCISLNHDVFS